MKTRKRQVTAIGLSGLLVAILGFQGYAMSLGGAIERSRPQSLLGNHSCSITSLSDPGAGNNEFTFAVVGDTKSHGTFEKLTTNILKQKPDFMILLGDFVPKARLMEHRYFQMEMAEAIPETFPVFLIPGNHDVNGDGFTMEDFAEEYGDPFFTFTYQNVYFVFCPI